MGIEWVSIQRSVGRDLWDSDSLYRKRVRDDLKYQLLKAIIDAEKLPCALPQESLTHEQFPGLGRILVEMRMPVRLP